MDENYMMGLWRGCRHPARQVQLISELCGRPVEDVIKVLRERGAIGADVAAGNYKKKLAGTVSAPVSEELRRYIVTSPKHAGVLETELGVSAEEIGRIRKGAADKARKMKEEAKCRRQSKKSKPFAVKLS